MFARATKFAASLVWLAPLLVSSICFAGTGGIFATGTGNSSSRSSSTSGGVLPGSAGTSPTAGLRGLDNMPSIDQSSSRSADPAPAETNLPLRGLLPAAATGQQVTGTVSPVSPVQQGPSATPSATPSAALSGSAFRPETPGRVESFFQVEGMRRYPGSPANNANKDKLSQDNHQKSVRSSVGRFLWHTLDNIGVPMFFGNEDDDLDPNLVNGYIVPGENGAHTAPPDKSHATANGAERNQPGLHKIPESELEGVNFSGKDDAPSATP